MKKKLYLLLCLGFVFASICACGGEQESEDNTPSVQTEEAEIEQDEPVQQEEIVIEEPEDEGSYKEICNHLYYDDVFFGEEDLEGAFVKIDLFIAERRQITSEALANYSFEKLYENNNLYKDFFFACVLRENEDSYVGESISLFFNQDYDFAPEDFEEGQKITIYGKIIHWSDNTMSGYNQVFVVPKYIEK